MTLPNANGFPPGFIVYIISFNHDTNRFEIVASGQVSEDGSAVVSDPGSGISTAGWGGFCPPYPNSGNADNCDFECTDNGIVEGSEARANKDCAFPGEQVFFEVIDDLEDSGGEKRRKMI